MDRSSCTSQLYERQKPCPMISDRASDLRGRYWDRTSDLFGVNADADVRVLTGCTFVSLVSCVFVIARVRS